MMDTKEIRERMLTCGDDYAEVIALCDELDAARKERDALLLAVRRVLARWHAGTGVGDALLEMDETVGTLDRVQATTELDAARAEIARLTAENVGLARALTKAVEGCWSEICGSKLNYECPFRIEVARLTAANADLCDELDAARAANGQFRDFARLADTLRAERDELIDGIKHALNMIDHLDEDDFRVRDLRHHLMGTVTERL